LLKVGFRQRTGNAAESGALAVGIRPGPILSATARSVDAGGVIARVLASGAHQFSGDDDDVLPILTPSGWVVLVGLGEESGQDIRRLRRIGGNLFQAVAESGFKHLDVALDLDPEETAEVAYGLCLRSWRPAERYRSKPDPEKVWTLRSATLLCDAPKAAERHFRPLAGRAKAADWARDLIVAPASELTPRGFLRCLEALEKLHVEVTAVEPAANGLRLLEAVGRGSRHPPLLAVLRWQGGKPKDAPLVFVGKGITFDSGGISIKPHDDMEEMKGDMAGAAAVAGAIRALADRKAPVNVVGVLALAENMPSGSACRPGDVVIGHAGLSVEIVDTDAEGRLILADALSYAGKTFRPQAMIDLATLTDAVEVALGRIRAGLFSTDDAFCQSLLAAGEAEDEKLWPLPLTDLYDDALKSEVADLKNCEWSHGPDALHAARFLAHFVPPDVPWAHVDIAGVSEAEEDGPLSGEGPTAFGIRLLDRLADEA
jgi:leucyl aminopeptidase